MDVTRFHGAQFVFADVTEAVSADWNGFSQRADVIRVKHAPPDHWPQLRAHGFLPKPERIMWVAEACASEKEFLARIAPRERQKVRGARRRMMDGSLKIETRGVGTTLFDAFLEIYEPQISRMRHGVAIARDERELILGNRDRYLAICVHDNGTLTGCCLVEIYEPADMVRARFSAVAPSHRRDSLSRVMYMEAAQVTRQLGYRWFSLGKDTNLYGHTTQPGLLRFKSHLGFTGRPSHLIDPATGTDQADLILGLRELADPSMLMSYAGDAPSDQLRLDVFGYSPDVDIKPFRAPFLSGCRTHRLPCCPVGLDG